MAVTPTGESAPPTVVCVVGPTATGKTHLAVGLALRLGRSELVNADSRQLLRGLRVGTNAPTPAELWGVPCHLLDLAEPGAPFSVADWLGAARRCLAELDARGTRAILVGGTGLYVRALLDGFDLSGDPPDPERRAWLSAAAATPGGLAELAGELRRRDPQGSASVDLRNPRRVVRALEIVTEHGSMAARPGAGPPRPALRIGVEAAPAVHRHWIAERARQMVEGGLLEEAEAALRRGVPAPALEAAGIGYREALAVLGGRMSAALAIDEIVRRTRRYARAQRTWFRADPAIAWLRREADTAPEAMLEAAFGLVAASR